MSSCSRSSGGAAAEEGPGQQRTLSSLGLKEGPDTRSGEGSLNIIHCTWLYTTNPLPQTPLLIPHFSKAPLLQAQSLQLEQYLGTLIQARPPQGPALSL